MANNSTRELQLRLTINGQQSLNTISKLEIETEQLVSKQRELAKAVEQARKKFGEQSNEFKAATKALNENKNAIAANNAEINKLRDSEGFMLRTTQSLNRERKELNRTLALNTLGTDKYIAAQKRLADVEKELSARKNAKTFFQQLKEQGPAALIGGLAGGAVGIAAQMFSMLANSVSGAISKFATLSDTLANMRKATGLSSFAVAKLNDDLSKIDTRSTKQSLQEIVIIAGQLGVANSQILNFTKSTDKLSVALGDEFKGGAEEITNTFGTLRNVLSDIKTDNVGDDILHIGNAINVLGAEGLATGPVVADITNRIASAGQVFGVTAGQSLGLAAAFQEMGISSERGSTATIKLLEKMASEPAQFAKIAGMSTAKFKDLVNTNIVQALIYVSKGFTKSKGDAIEFASKLGDAEISSASIAEVLSKVGQNAGLVGGKIKLASNALKETSSIQEEFSIKNNTAAAEMDRAGRVWDRWVTSIGSFLAMVASPAIKWVASFGKQNADLAETFHVQQNRIDRTEKAIKPLITRYSQLKTEIFNSAEKQAELNEVIAEMGKIVPDAVTEVDNYGNAIAVNVGLLNIYIQKQKEATKQSRDTAALDLRNKVFELNARRDVLKQEIELGSTSYRTVSRRLVSRKYTADEIRERQAELKSIKEESDKLLQTYKELYITQKVVNQPVTKPPKSKYNSGSSTSDKDKDEQKRLAEEKLDNEARLIAEIKKMRIDMISNESDKKEAQLRIEAKQEIAKERKLISEKKLSQETFDRWLKTRNKKLNDDIIQNDKQTNEKIVKESDKINLEAAKRKLETEKEKYQADLELAKATGDSKKELDSEINILIADKELALLVATEEERLSIIDRFAIREKALKEKYIRENSEKEIKAIEKLRDAQGDYEKLIADKKEKLYAKVATYVQQINNVVSELFNFERQGIENQQNQEDNRYNQRMVNLERQKEAGIISEAEYNQKKTEFESQHDAKSRELKKKMFEADKKARIAQIIMTTAQAVIAALATVPPNPALSIASAIIGGIQLANALSAEAPAYATGDFIGNSKTSYPINSKPTTSAQLIWANEKGQEFMLNNDAVTSPDFPFMLPFLRQMNAGKPIIPDISSSISPRVRRYDKGDFILDPNQNPASVNTSPAISLSNNSNSRTAEVIERLNSLLEGGVTSTVIIGYKEAKEIQDLIKEVDKIKQQSNAA